MTFLTGALTPLVDGTVKPEKLPSLLDADLKIIEEEHHAPLGVLTKTADALPGFGIVAAVLGIVITMSSINGPVDEIGEKVGAALVGTFLGILLSYGFFAPMAVRMEFLAQPKSASCESSPPPFRDLWAISRPRSCSNRPAAESLPSSGPAARKWTTGSEKLNHQDHNQKRG